ncbi:MAG: choice-of-anchor V domain-containing protein [Candidatus Bathyarchaeia archaeon]
MKKISFPLIVLVSMSLLIVAGAYAYSGGKTGKSDTGCGGCHGGSPGPATTVTISGLPGAYEPGKTYSLTVTVTSTDVPGTDGGFDLSVTAGTLVVTNSTATQILDGELVHTSAGSHQRSWSFNWTAPTSGDAIFYVAGLAADGDGGTDGDAWATYSTTVPIIPEFPGFTLLLVLAAVTIVVLFLAKKMLPRVTVERKI